MSKYFNWWQGRWECTTMDDAQKILKDTQDPVYLKQGNQWKEIHRDKDQLQRVHIRNGRIVGKK